MADDDGVLENLPSKRPGRRSSKREMSGTPAKAADTAAAKAERSGKAAAKPPRTARASRASAKAADAATERRPPRAIQPEPAGDPVTTAARTAAGLTVTGVRIAGAVTREVLRRIPRP